MITDTIQNIAKRCWETAVRRGQDTTCNGCQLGFRRELSEYWAAVEAGRVISSEDVAAINEAAQIDDNTFYACYESRAHNTSIDELADIVIVAATWYEAATLEDGDDFNPIKSAENAYVCGVLNLVSEISYNNPSVISLHDIINLKMRFNELRQN